MSKDYERTLGKVLDATAAEGILYHARSAIGAAPEGNLFSERCIDASRKINMLPGPDESRGQPITAAQLRDSIKSWDPVAMETSSSAGYYAARPSITAEVDQSTKTRYFNSVRVQSLDKPGMIGLLLYEAIHTLTGYGAGAIQETIGLSSVDALGFPVSSKNITSKLAAVCGVGLPRSVLW